MIGGFCFYIGFALGCRFTNFRISRILDREIAPIFKNRPKP